MRILYMPLCGFVVIAVLALSTLTGTRVTCAVRHDLRRSGWRHPLRERIRMIGGHA